MDKRIIYKLPNDDSLYIVVPSGDCNLSIEQLAQNEVPSGVAYKIVDVSDFPTDTTFAAAWDADFSSPDGIGGA